MLVMNPSVGKSLACGFSWGLHYHPKSMYLEGESPIALTRSYCCIWERLWKPLPRKIGTLKHLSPILHRNTTQAKAYENWKWPGNFPAYRWRRRRKFTEWRYGLWKPLYYTIIHAVLYYELPFDYYHPMTTAMGLAPWKWRKRIYLTKRGNLPEVCCVDFAAAPISQPNHIPLTYPARAELGHLANTFKKQMAWMMTQVVQDDFIILHRSEELIGWRGEEGLSLQSVIPICLITT